MSLTNRICEVDAVAADGTRMAGGMRGPPAPVGDTRVPSTLGDGCGGGGFVLGAAGEGGVCLGLAFVRGLTSRCMAAWIWQSTKTILEFNALDSVIYLSANVVHEQYAVR
jgi:hypothetical protein